MADELLINLAFLLPRPTGTSTYAINLLPHLQALHPTLLVAEAMSGRYKSLPVPANMTAAQGARGHFRRLMWNQLRLPQHYRTLHSQLLFCPIPEAPLFAGCRSVVTAHDLIPLRFPKRFSPLMPYFRYYVPQVLHQAEHILCNSLATADDIQRFFGIEAAKMTTIPLAYDADHFRCLELPTGNYFLYVGRSEAYKNLQRLISAFAQLPGDHDLWLAGPADGRQLPRLQAQIAELGLSQRVKLLDYVPYDDLPRVINQAIALVLPSLWEGFGLPVLEAMACGTPVITSNLSSLPEVAGDAALLVNPYRVEEIGAAMGAIATDASLRADLRAAGLARARQFSWVKTGEATAAILRQYC